ncbi:MAG TPA: secretin and TonB N-terminal domain-containing protein, partial [Methylophilaceae bacterium]|nr:secretin and TonB N-terminal domain-containing protein [Methylophilaceae bacterium]
QARKIEQSNADYEQAKALINAGKVEEGIRQLKAMAHLHPDDPQYRGYLQQAQNEQITALLAEGDQDRRERRWEEAENAYRRTLEIDANNQPAQDALRELGGERRHEAMMLEANRLFADGNIDRAQNIARDVLAENVNHAGARALFERIEQQRIDKIINPPQIEAAFKRPITLEFKDVSVKSVFEFIAQSAGINFSYDQELNGEQRTSVFLRNTPIKDAIDVILSSNQLGKKALNGNTLLIYPLSRSQEYQETYVRSFYLSNLEAKKALNLIKTVVKSKDVYIDETLNTLVMRDTAEAIRTAEKLISSQDMAEPEVMLEVTVLELNRRNLEAIGIRYPDQIALGVQGRSTVDGLTTLTPGRLTVRELTNFNSDLGVFSINDPVLALNLLRQDTDTNLLANPHIRVRNREKAKIHVGDRIPVLTSIANATGFVSQTVSYIEVGIKLDVQPTILLQNEVGIKVGLEVSNQTDQLISDSGTVTYTIGTRNAITNLRLKDGETQILAGLFRNDEQKITSRVPGLSDLPFIGKLFSDDNNDTRKKEIVLLITPHILSNITPADAVYTTFPAGIDRDTGRTRAGRPIADYAPAPPQAIAPSPQELQAERARADRDFGGSVMQPIDQIANPYNMAP